MDDLLIRLIREAMTTRAWKQIDLSKASSVTQSAISRILNGSQNVKISNIRKILMSLDLLNEIDTENDNPEHGYTLHEEIIAEFQNKELARDISVDLLEIEKIDHRQLEGVRIYLQGMKNALRLNGSGVKP